MPLSWFGAVIFTPYLGFLLLKVSKHDSDSHHDLFATPFYNRLRYWINVSVSHRKKVILATVLLFLIGIVALLQVPQQFFPLSNRPEIMVDLWLPEGSSFAETEAATKRLEAILAGDEDVVSYAAYVGGGTPRFFLLIIGIIALVGMIMRNSVILVDQIEQEEKEGRDTWNAIIESTVRRFRSIMLTAAAAILAMIPLSFNDFFGPQAIAIMGGLTVATGLTIFFLPALYAAWFRVECSPQHNRVAGAVTTIKVTRKK